MEKVFEIKTRDLFISQKEVSEKLGIQVSGSVKANGKKYVPVPLGSKVTIWLSDDSNKGGIRIEKGDGELVYISLPLSDPGYYYDLIKYGSEKNLATNWSVGEHNCVVHAFKSAFANEAMGSAFAKALGGR